MADAWWENPATALEVMRVFSRFQHSWTKVAGSTMLEALCTGFKTKATNVDKDAKVSCPGCLSRLKGIP